MSYDPKTHKFPFPEDTDKHYITVKKDNGLVFDAKYPYIDDSKFFRFKKAIVRILLYILVFPVATVRTGLRIKGRKNLKKHKELLKKGVISCSNHVHFWDYIGVMKAVRPFKPYVIVWARNIRGENGTISRLTGGIPFPDDNIHGAGAFMRAVTKMLDGGWLHIYAEGSMWEYYKPIRPFKGGMGSLAIKTGKPILPLAFSYREPGFIRKKIFRQIALLDLHIGEPIFADEDLPQHEKENDITRRAHDEVCRLAGIDPEDNLYPPLFDNCKRVDYY